MSVKIISSNKKTITLEVTMNLDGENFLQTEELSSNFLKTNTNCLPLFSECKNISERYSRP